MTNLIQRMLGKEKKSHVETRLSDKEIEPFFQAHGIDINTIGFPFMEYRDEAPTEAYWTHFRDVILTPVKVNDVVKTIIIGKYEVQAMASDRDSSGDWHPGTYCRYSFRIEDGDLSLKEK